MIESHCKVGERVRVALANTELLLCNVYTHSAAACLDYDGNQAFFASASIPGTFDFVVCAAPRRDLEDGTQPVTPELSMEVFRLHVEPVGTMRLLIGAGEPVPTPTLVDNPFTRTLRGDGEPLAEQPIATVNVPTLELEPAAAIPDGAVVIDDPFIAPERGEDEPA